jgi:hypothetical protein
MLVASLLGMDFVDYAFVPVAGTCGGILVAAKHPDIRLSDVRVGCFSVSVLVHTGDDSERPPWWLTVVYGPQGDSEKELFLEELSAVRDACSGPWAVLGDFNLILDEADKNNDSINRRNMSRFRQTVAELELLDIHLHGRRYTWSNERRSPTLVRLDRALVSIDWEALYPDCHLQALSSDASDHCPLLLQTQMSIHSKPRFHFETFWPKTTGVPGGDCQGLGLRHDYYRPATSPRCVAAEPQAGAAEVGR